MTVGNSSAGSPQGDERTVIESNPATVGHRANDQEATPPHQQTARRVTTERVGRALEQGENDSGGLYLPRSSSAYQPLYCRRQRNASENSGTAQAPTKTVSVYSRPVLKGVYTRPQTLSRQGEAGDCRRCVVGPNACVHTAFLFLPGVSASAAQALPR